VCVDVDIVFLFLSRLLASARARRSIAALRSDHPLIERGRVPRPPASGSGLFSNLEADRHLSEI
jgi:hypothetical protein